MKYKAKFKKRSTGYSLILYKKVIFWWNIYEMKPFVNLDSVWNETLRGWKALHGDNLVIEDFRN